MVANDGQNKINKLKWSQLSLLLLCRNRSNCCRWWFDTYLFWLSLFSKNGCSHKQNVKIDISEKEDIALVSWFFWGVRYCSPTETARTIQYMFAIFSRVTSPQLPPSMRWHAPWRYGIQNGPCEQQQQQQPQPPDLCGHTHATKQTCGHRPGSVKITHNLIVANWSRKCPIEGCRCWHKNLANASKKKTVSSNFVCCVKLVVWGSWFKAKCLRSILRTSPPYISCISDETNVRKNQTWVSEVIIYNGYGNCLGFRYVRSCTSGIWRSAIFFLG